MELHLRGAPTCLNDSTTTTTTSSSSVRQQMNPPPLLSSSRGQNTSNNHAIVERDRDENKENSVAAALPAWTSPTTFWQSPRTTTTCTSSIFTTSSTLCQQVWLLYQEHEIGVLLFLIGVWNNGPYVIMLASAKDVSEGGVALVYIANILPGLLVKASGSYWFDKVSYSTRLYMASALMGCAFLSVAFFASRRSTTITTTTTNGAVVHHHWTTLAGELFGIALISAQCALGEASLLAWAGRDGGGGGSSSSNTAGHQALTWFASGTGLAGPIGYLYHTVCVQVLHWSLATTCAASVLTLAVVYSILTQRCLHRGETSCATATVQHQRNHYHHNHYDVTEEGEEQDERISSVGDAEEHVESELATISTVQPSMNEADRLVDTTHHQDYFADEPHDLHQSVLGRLKLSLSLWPFMIPLFAVYAAEYACQSGTWTGMGFPVESESARRTFYTRANWLYQIGVFLSRSSGTLFTVSRLTLWIMPGLQIVNLVFFYWTAQMSPTPFWYSPPIMYGLALWTGLLGGAVYVHGYRRVIADVAPVHCEFALATVSLAESLGVLVADVVGLFLQACLYEVNNLPGAIVQCPLL